MAYATNAIDINRKTEGIELPADISREIIQNAVEESIVMRLAERVSLPGRGISIPVVTGDPVADFVAETNEKPVSDSTFATKTMTPYKIAVIELFSDEFRRDLPALYDALVRRLPYAISRKFDQTVLNGTAPGTGFDVLSGSAAVNIAENTYAQVVAAKTAVASANASLDGWALSPAAEGLLLSAADTQGRPLFVQNITAEGSVSAIFGAPALVSSAAYAEGTPNTIGVAGDWTQARYGIVDGINIEFSNQATINTGTEQVNLWQRNMFAVRCEAEVGFVVAKPAAFVKLTDGAGE